MEVVDGQATGRAGPTGSGKQASGHGDRPDARGWPHAGPPGSRAPPVPDLDTVMAVERKISDRRRFASRSELLAALDASVEPAGLDRVLEYLEGSAKISTYGGLIRWTFSGAGTRKGPDAEEEGGGAPGEPPSILSMAERTSADLDNDLPYSAEIERLIEDCDAGRPIGKTHTAEEFLRHFDREYGGGNMGRPAG